MLKPSSHHNKNHKSVAANTAFSSLDLVGQCMADGMRSNQFDRAIRSIVQPRHSVIDVGTGSGLLALFAASAGARKVTAIEFDPYIAEVAREHQE